MSKRSIASLGLPEFLIILRNFTLMNPEKVAGGWVELRLRNKKVSHGSVYILMSSIALFSPLKMVLIDVDVGHGGSEFDSRMHGVKKLDVFLYSSVCPPPCVCIP